MGFRNHCVCSGIENIVHFDSLQVTDVPRWGDSLHDLQYPIIPSAMPGPELGAIRQLMNRRHWTSRQRKNSSNPPRRSRRVGSMKQSWSIRHRLNKQSKVRCAQNAEDLQQLAPNTHEGHSAWRIWASWPYYRASIIDLPRELVRWYHIFWGSNLNETQKTSLKINESLLKSHISELKYSWIQQDQP